MDNQDKKLAAYYSTQSDKEKATAGVEYLNSITTWDLKNC